MKKKFFLMFTLATMIFAACNNDIISNGDDDIVTDPKGDAWVALKVITPSTPSTRGLNNPNQENGSAEESKIKSIRAIFFTMDADPIVTADMELRNEEAGITDDGRPTGNPGNAFTVPATSKRILLVANPSENFPSLNNTVGKKYSDINAAITEDVGNISSIEGFMMTNAKGGLEPSLEGGEDTELKLYKTVEAANRSPLSVKIDRVVAKVRVNIETNTEAPAIIDLNNGGWALNVTNTKYFPVSERVATWYELNGGGFRAPFDQYKLGSYRRDPNYDSQNGSLDYHYINEFNVTGDEWLGNHESKYCFENTQDAPYNMHAYTTHVLFKIKFIPAEYKLPDSDTPVMNQESNGDWMLINGGYYTFTTLMSWIEAELTYKFSQEDPTIVPTALTNAFNRYLGPEGIGIGEVELPNNAGDIATTMSAFADTKEKIIQFGPNRARSVGNLTYYAEATCYYKAIIKHDDTKDAINELGEFGVVRNSVYDINVTKFNSPGYPTIPEPGTNEPDEEEGNWLSVQINVNPWTWYSQEEEF